MKIAIPKESQKYEGRIAASPETVKKYIAMGFEVAVEKGAGINSSITDDDFKMAGAKIQVSKELYKNASLILKVQKPMIKEDGLDEVSLYEKGTTVVSTVSAMNSPNHLKAYEKAGINVVAMELIPRITRAQSMDVLSSQSNLAGYKAVLDAAEHLDKAMPMMMTAAGTVSPAKVLIIGAGVAGLQAIATAKRLGAVVSAFDVRAAAKEQVESLGASFVEVEGENAEGKGGYAKEVSAEYKKRQADKLKEELADSDIVICTALIPGRPAPKIITTDMVKGMKPGSVIVDLAVEMGGNCELSEFAKVVVKQGVIIVGHANVPSRLARDASKLYAKNLLNFVTLLFDPESKTLKFKMEDEIIKDATVVLDGKISRDDLKVEKKAPVKKAAPEKKK
jgi:NAD(P) transhydrogenase subunit alpha